ISPSHAAGTAPPQHRVTEIIARAMARRNSAGRTISMKRSTDRILTTHVGSIVRPKWLLDITAAAQVRPDAVPAYEAGVRDAIAEVVRQQAAAGIDIVNDGEYGKS